MKTLLSLCILLLSSGLHAQKETVETMDAGGITSIVFSADEIFKIHVTTAPVKSISIKTHSDGEYYNRISLDSQILGQSLVLSSRFREILQSGYDKLSAHKVFAMEVFLEVPNDLSVDIRSNLASAYVSGDYASLLIQLESGSCYLEDLTADATVNTHNGNIFLEAEDAHVSAKSRHGEVLLSEWNSGSHKIVLSSINGNIKVVNTK